MFNLDDGDDDVQATQFFVSVMHFSIMDLQASADFQP